VSSLRLLLKPLGWLGAGLAILIRVLLVAWATLAIYYSNLPWPALRVVLAIAFAAFATWAIWFSRQRRAHGALAVLYLGVILWWLAIPPSHDRHWRPEVAVMPRAIVDGDRVHLTNVRNFVFRTADDFTVRYEERDVRLSMLTGIDFYISFWAKGPVGHTFLSFTFADAPPLSISIETRPEVGEDFHPLASLFKQFELIYVVGDERDIVGLRTNHRDESVFLYRLNTSPENARRLFLVYLERINELADQPEWYHLFSNNCTLNIIRYANAAGRRGRFDIRHLLNGLIDSYLYYSGRLDTSLPLDELRRLSRIDEAAQVADNSPDFSERIRAALPSVTRR